MYTSMPSTSRLRRVDSKRRGGFEFHASSWNGVHQSSSTTPGYIPPYTWESSPNLNDLNVSDDQRDDKSDGGDQLGRGLCIADCVCIVYPGVCCRVRRRLKLTVFV